MVRPEREEETCWDCVRPLREEQKLTSVALDEASEELGKQLICRCVNWWPVKHSEQHCCEEGPRPISQH